MNKLICIVGMAGSGKSEVSECLMKLSSFEYIRLGQLVLDRVQASGRPHSEALEREIRENIRAEHGMAAMAILNLVEIREKLRLGNVIVDGLYSWEEYNVFKEEFKQDLVVIAVYAPPEVRYDRLSGRHLRHGVDEKMRFRSFSREQAIARDAAEIENLHKAGPIAMADYTVINTSTLAILKKQLQKIHKFIFK